MLGGIQDGVAELKIPLLVVGHEKCGAVKATVEAVEKKSAPSGTDIDALVTAIRPAVATAEEEKATDMLDAAVRHNVTNNVTNIVADPGAKAILSAAVTAGARYELDTGEVEWL